MSDANRVVLRYVAEAAYNATPPDSPNWQSLRFVSESFVNETQVTDSEEIRADRMHSDPTKTGENPSASLSVELSPATYDDFLEALMGSDWAVNELVVGTNDYSFTFEKEFQDITGDKFINFTGMRVGQFDMAVEYGSRVTGEFSFAGAGSTHLASSAVGTGTVAAPTTTRIFDGSNHISGVKIDGIAADECIRSLNLSINSNLRPKECIGNSSPMDQVKGSLMVSGDLSIYLEDLDLDKTRVANTPISLEFTLSRGGQGYTFLLPRVFLSGSTPSSPGIDQDVFFESSFSAKYDSTEDTSLKITRLP